MSKYDDSYLSLPNFFYQVNKPTIFSKSKIFILNKLLLKNVDPFITELDLKKILLENKKKKIFFTSIFWTSVWTFHKSRRWKSNDYWRTFIKK